MPATAFYPQHKKRELEKSDQVFEESNNFSTERRDDNADKQTADFFSGLFDGDNPEGLLERDPEYTLSAPVPPQPQQGKFTVFDPENHKVTTNNNHVKNQNNQNRFNNNNNQQQGKKRFPSANEVPQGQSQQQRHGIGGKPLSQIRHKKVLKKAPRNNPQNGFIRRN